MAEVGRHVQAGTVASGLGQRQSSRGEHKAIGIEPLPLRRAYEEASVVPALHARHPEGRSQPGTAVAKRSQQRLHDIARAVTHGKHLTGGLDLQGNTQVLFEEHPDFGQRPGEHDVAHRVP